MNSVTSARARLQVGVVAGHHPRAFRPRAEVDAVLKNVEALRPPPHLLCANSFVRPVPQRVIDLRQFRKPYGELGNNKF